MSTARKRGKTRIDVDLSGGTLASIGGVVLLGRAEERLHAIPRLASCFEYFRTPVLTAHPVEALFGQRLLELGQEAVSDHDR